MDQETFRDFSFSFASGLLEGPELDAFLTALAAADEERLLVYADASALAQDLAMAAPPPELASYLRPRLLAKATLSLPTKNGARKAPPGHAPTRPGEWMPSDGGTGSHGSRPTGWGEMLGRLLRGGAGLGIGFAVLVLGAGVLFYAFRIQGDMVKKEYALEDSRKRITVLEDSLTRREALLEVLLSHNLQVVVMQGHEKDPTGYGKMIWCPKRRCGILHVANLPPVPDHREYQLWFLEADGSAPINAGLFRVKKTTWDGDLFRVQGMAEVERARLKGFMVTLEPEGGAAAPSGDTYLSGSTLM